MEWNPLRVWHDLACCRTWSVAFPLMGRWMESEGLCHLLHLQSFLALNLKPRLLFRNCDQCSNLNPHVKVHMHSPSAQKVMLFAFSSFAFSSWWKLTCFTMPSKPSALVLPSFFPLSFFLISFFLSYPTISPLGYTHSQASIQNILHPRIMCQHLCFV